MKTTAGTYRTQIVLAERKRRTSQEGTMEDWGTTQPEPAEVLRFYKKMGGVASEDDGN